MRPQYRCLSTFVLLGTLFISGCSDSVSAPQSFLIGVMFTGDGIGTVTSQPEGLNCTSGGGACQAEFDEGTEVSLIATAAVGNEFAGWSEGCTGTGNCSLTVDAALDVSAEFEDPEVETQTIGMSGGTISSPDGKITLTFPTGALGAGTEISIREVAASSLGPEWDGVIDDDEPVWELGPSGTVFAEPVMVEIVLPDPGTGDPADLDLLLLTLSGEEVELLGGGETTRSGGMIHVTGQISHFSEIVVMDPDRLGIIALFDVPSTQQLYEPFDVTAIMTTIPKLEMAARPTWEDASESPVWISGSSTFPFENGDGIQYSTTITYTCVDTGTGQVKGTAHVALGTFVTKTFGPISQDVECVGPPEHTLSVTLSGSGTGSVTSDPAGINCPEEVNGCSTVFTQGTEATLTATPDSGSLFCGWTLEGGETEAAQTLGVTVADDTSVNACFEMEEEVVLSLDPFSAPGSGSAPYFTVFPAGEYPINVVDEFGDTQGVLPVVFSNIPNVLFAGSPDRWLLHEGAGVTLMVGDGTYPADFAGVDGPEVQLCGTGNAAPEAVRVRRFAENGVVLTVSDHPVQNDCLSPFVSAFSVEIELISTTVYPGAGIILRLLAGPPE